MSIDVINVQGPISKRYEAFMWRWWARIEWKRLEIGELKLSNEEDMMQGDEKQVSQKQFHAYGD